MMSVCPAEGSVDRANTQAPASGSKDDAPDIRSCDNTTWRADVVPFSYTSDKDLDAWPSDEDEAKDSGEDTATSGSSDGAHSLSSDEDPPAWSADGRLPSCSHHEDPNDEVKPTDLTAAATDSSVHTTTFQNPIQGFTAAFCCCCCCCCTVDD